MSPFLSIDILICLLFGKSTLRVIYCYFKASTFSTANARDKQTEKSVILYSAFIYLLTRLQIRRSLEVKPARKERTVSTKA